MGRKNIQIADKFEKYHLCSWYILILYFELNRNQTGGFDVFFTQAILWQQADRGFAGARGDDLLGFVDIIDLLRIVAQFEKRGNFADTSVLFF